MRIEINNTTNTKINKKILKQAADVFGKKMKVKNKEVSIVFVSENRIKRLNKIYRGLDKITDVLSFEDSGNDSLGEIIMCYPQIKKQAKKRNTPLQNELIFIFIHGLLHLIGYEDKTEKGRRIMEELGDEFCKSIIGA